MGKFDLDADYNEVKFRIVEFREKHPEGSLQPADLSKPYTVETIGGETYIVVVAAAHRSPDDPRPGIGMAYEVFPGKTPYTKGSELMNAETSAWGRAIVAALAADTSKSVASATEVRNRQAERAEQPAAPPADPTPADLATEARARLLEVCTAAGITPAVAVQQFAEMNNGADLRNTADHYAVDRFTDWMRQEWAAAQAVAAGAGAEGGQ